MMKRCTHACLLASILALGLFGGPFGADAHGTAFKLLQDPTLAAVQFRYSDGEPMAYAEVMVFSPQDTKVEHQNGRTDKLGKFAFCPDMFGAWRITANDGMGHLCEATVKVAGREATGEVVDRPQQETAVTSPVEGTRTLKVIAGLSLIGNLGFASWFFSRKFRMAKRMDL